MPLFFSFLCQPNTTRTPSRRAPKLERDHERKNDCPDDTQRHQGRDRPARSHRIVLNDSEAESYFVATVAETCALIEAGYELLNERFVG